MAHRAAPRALCRLQRAAIGEILRERGTERRARHSKTDRVDRVDDLADRVERHRNPEGVDAHREAAIRVADAAVPPALRLPVRRVAWSEADEVRRVLPCGVRRRARRDDLELLYEKRQS